ncbi:hypothetical protein HY345_03290 [Candidatus Microgenomates bacterium]|nr:hypothetical protein [Candidatus Microgenomates bacterium]
MKKKLSKNPLKQVLLFVFLLVSLPILVFAGQLVINIIGRASGSPANLVIDYNSNLGQIQPAWQALAQGGEEKAQMLAPAVNEIRSLSPQYIRIDHLYDLYDIVSRSPDGRINYDFSQLDRTVDNILQAGALPFFALSYMPPDIADGDVVEKPRNWQEWSNLVRATVEHYSGRSGRNLAGLYYEVWNEPDLFGRWSINGGKNYLELYYHSVIGAQTAQNANAFKIGGPVTTGMYPNWIRSLVEYSRNNNLRLDFLSYHRYSKDTEVFSRDWKGIQDILDSFPAYKNLEIIVSEWGSDAENSPNHDGVFDSAHTIAAMRQLLDRVKWAFSFEIKDGPADREYWGRWGILTHEKYGLNKKPKYFALKFLNNLSGDRLKIDGEGSWVTAIATKAADKIKIILVNYDPYGSHSENVPLTINNLPNANYQVKTTYLFGSTREEILSGKNGFLRKTISLGPQSSVLVEMTKMAPEHSFSLGYFGFPENRGLSLTDKDLPLKLSAQQFTLVGNGSMDFFIKQLWNEEEEETVNIFSIQLDNGQELALKREKVGFGQRLSFGVYKDGLAQNTVLASISEWSKGQWHHLGLTWSKEKLAIFVDGEKIQESSSGVDIILNGVFSFANFGGVIDELRIVGKQVNSLSVPTEPYELSGDTLFLRHFDGTTLR